MKKVFSTIKSFLKETDILLFSLCVITSAFGLLMVYSATRYTLKDGAHFSREFIIMLLAVFLGIIAALFLSYFDYQVYTKFWPVIAVFCVIIMLVLFKWGTGPSSRPDARTWLSIGPINFQPSELVKIGFIITFGVHLDKVKEKINNIFSILQLGAHAAVPIVLVAATGDMGSALVFMVIAIVMMFVAGVHWGYFLGGIALVGAATPLIWTYLLKQLQKDRFLALIYPDLYPDIIYQQQRGLNAIGAGGITGQGLFKGAYTQAGAVPESQNDMIFSIICEELGLFGAMCIILVFALMLWRIIHIAQNAPDLFGTMLAAGVFAHVAVQVVLNIAVVTNFIPNTGVSLPFISYGGSSILFLLIEMGLVMSVARGIKVRDV